MPIEKKLETMSNWNCVTQLLETNEPIQLGKYASYWYHRTPRRFLHSMSYYKFAAKMIGGPKKRVLDVGCNEGLGSWMLAKECGFCHGVDLDEAAIDAAQKNFSDPCISFTCEDFLEQAPQQWDAVTSFDVIEHIYPENSPLFLRTIAVQLKENGVAVIGTPSQISQEFASPVSKKGHVNIYTHEKLERELRKYFQHVFLFSANDEMVHTGFYPLAHYFIALACKPFVEDK